MSENLYDGYKYSRPRAKRKGVLFLAVIIIIGIVVVWFSINIFIGPPVETKGLHLELPGLEFSAVGVEGLPSKANALEIAREMRLAGGAGFVDFDGEWFVLEEIGTGEMKFTGESIEINILSVDHKDKVDSIIKSFNKNSETLRTLISKSSREISAEALTIYNELTVEVLELDKYPICAAYSSIRAAANKQLLALYVLSAEKDSDNISSAVKHCICSINFAYLELLTSLN